MAIPSRELEGVLILRLVNLRVMGWISPGTGQELESIKCLSIERAVITCLPFLFVAIYDQRHFSLCIVCMRNNDGTLEILRV
jgi:hypothetical protein